jgi:DNA-binding MarR family transcriptional regulator
LTGILRRLEDRGVICRVPDPRDSRRSLLFLTPAGRKLDVSVKGTIEDAVGQVLARSTPERIEEASQLLAAVARSLAKISVEKKPETRKPKVAARRSSSRGSARSG